MNRLRAAWVVHAPVGLVVTPAKNTSRVFTLMKYVVAAHEGCVDGEEVARDRGLGGQKLGPGDVGAVRGRVDVVVFEDFPHGRGCELVA